MTAPKSPSNVVMSSGQQGGAMAFRDGLKGRRILVVEDEYFIADDLDRWFRNCDAAVIGPAPSLDQAMALIAEHPDLDGAILDINLDGEWVYPLADILVGSGIPFVFVTGYDEAALPARFADAKLWSKPVDPGAVAATLFDGQLRPAQRSNAATTDPSGAFVARSDGVDATGRLAPHNLPEIPK